MSEAEIKAIVDKLADIARVLHEADPADKAEIFRQLGLKLTCHPGQRLIQATVEPAQYGFFDSVRGDTTLTYMPAIIGERTTICCVGMLALIAGTVSYRHMHRACESDGNVSESPRIRASSQLNRA